MRAHPLALALTLTLAALPWTPAAAVTWNAASDFTALTTANPNGAWSYGYDPAATAGYQFKAFNLLSSGAALAWTDSTYVSLGTPAFFKVVGASPIGGTAPGQVALHPGPAANDDAAILRFIAPATGSYAVSSQFFVGDSGETVAWVVKNGNFGVPLASLGVTSSNPVYTAAALSLNAGDTLDFVVGNAGSYFSDTTPLNVVISSAVPAPHPLALALAGLAALGGLVRRRRG